MGINLRSYVLSTFCESGVTSQEERMCYFVECHATIVHSKCINDKLGTINVFYLMIGSMLYNTCIPSYDRINYAQYMSSVLRTDQLCTVHGFCLVNGSIMYSTRIPSYDRVKCGQYIIHSIYDWINCVKYMYSVLSSYRFIRYG